MWTVVKHTSIRFGSPGVFNQMKEKKGEYFIGDMKKYGIITALNEMNNFKEFFESQPSKSVSRQQQPPSKEPGCAARSSVEMKPQSRDEKRDESKEEKSPFMFPFQRRARSYSPPSIEQINNKIAETIINNTKAKNERSCSNSLEGHKNSSAVVANTSFMIGGFESTKKRKFGDTSRRQGCKKEEIVIKSREVEEWLFNNEMSFSNDENEIFDRLTSNFGQNNDFSGIETLSRSGVKDERTKTDEFNKWMYQTVDMNEQAIVSAKVDPYENSDAENLSPNMYKQFQLENYHLENFLKDQKYSAVSK